MLDQLFKLKPVDGVQLFGERIRLLGGYRESSWCAGVGQQIQVDHAFPQMHACWRWMTRINSHQRQPSFGVQFPTRLGNAFSTLCSALSAVVPSRWSISPEKK